MICPQLSTSTSAQLLNQEYNINNKNAVKSTKKNPKNSQKIVKKQRIRIEIEIKIKNKKVKITEYIRAEHISRLHSLIRTKT